MKSALVWSFVFTNLGTILQFIASMVLARLLTPGEIGTFAIAGAVFAVAQVFRDIGVSSYLIREKQLSHKQIGGCVLITWLTCLTIACLFLVSARHLADFYQLPELIPVFYILAVNIAIVPFGTFAQSQLRKNLKFKVLGIIDSLSVVVHISVSITLALYDFAALSLAYASLASTACTLILVNIYNPNKLRFRLSFRGAQQVYSSVLSIGFVNILNSANAQSQPIAVGKLISEKAVALIDKASALVSLLDKFVLMAIRVVLTPVFSKLRDNKSELKDSYLVILESTLVMGWPFLLFINLHADFLIDLLFGSQWGEVTALVLPVSVAMSLSLCVWYLNELVVSLGHEAKALKLSFINLILKLMCLFVAAPYGLITMLYALILVELIRVVLAFYIKLKISDIALLDLLSKLAKASMVLAIIAIPVLISHDYQVKFSNTFVEFFSSALVFLISWLLAIFVVKCHISIEIKNLATRLGLGAKKV